MPKHKEAGFEHLREAMAAVFAETIEFEPGTLVTVLSAKMAANSAHATIRLSVFPLTKEKEVLKKLVEQKRYIKEALAERLRLRRMPDLHYSFDTTADVVATIEELINQIEHEQEQKKD